MGSVFMGHADGWADMCVFMDLVTLSLLTAPQANQKNSSQLMSSFTFT